MTKIELIITCILGVSAMYLGHLLGFPSVFIACSLLYYRHKRYN